MVEHWGLLMVTWAAKTAGPRAECWAILMVQHWGQWDYLMDVLMVWTLAVWLGQHWAESSATLQIGVV